MVVWGGTDTIDWLGDGRYYEPAADSWTVIAQTGAVPNKREGATAVQTGQTYMFGGWDGGNYYDDAYALNTTTSVWSVFSTTDQPSPRAHHIMMLAGQKGLFVWGGCAGQVCGTIHNDGATWHPATNWVPIPESPLLSARRDPVAVYSFEYVIIWGGFDGSSLLGDGARFLALP